jgi:hypothetical protein
MLSYGLEFDHFWVATGTSPESMVLPRGLEDLTQRTAPDPIRHATIASCRARKVPCVSREAGPVAGTLAIEFIHDGRQGFWGNDR